MYASWVRNSTATSEPRRHFHDPVALVLPVGFRLDSTVKVDILFQIFRYISKITSVESNAPDSLSGTEYDAATVTYCGSWICNKASTIPSDVEVYM